MTIAIGKILDELGHARQVTQRIVAVNHPGRNFDVETKANYRASPARNCRTRQAERITVNLDHDRSTWLGRVVHLEMRGRHLYAVADLHDPLSLPAGGTWQFSVETLSSYPRGSCIGEDIEITGIGLVRRSAQFGIGNVAFHDGTLDDRHKWRLPQPERAIADNAAQAQLKYQRQNPHLVERRPPGALEYSPWRGKILRVS